MTDRSADPIAGRVAPSSILELAKRLQQQVHEDAVFSNPLFSRAHWEHNAGPTWHHEDDNSYQAFENCQHPDCRLVREAALADPPVPSEPSWFKCVNCGREFDLGDPRAKEPCGSAACHPLRRGQADPPVGDVERRASGLCSAHQQPDRSCRICFPALGDVERPVESPEAK